MDYKTFKNLELEKQVELYNEWLTEIKMTEYYLYLNDQEGMGNLESNNFFFMPYMDIIDILTHAQRYELTDSLISYDNETGFRSLDDDDIQERFSNADFMDWLDGQRLGDHDVI